MSRTGLVYDEFLTKHRCPWDSTHPESAERYTKCLESIRNHGLVERCAVIEVSSAILRWVDGNQTADPSESR